MSRYVLPPEASGSHQIHDARGVAGSVGAHRQPDENTGGFGRVLSDKMLEGSRDNGLGAATPTLDRRALFRIIAEIQHQMNSAFFDAFDDSDDASPLSADPFAWIHSPRMGDPVGLPPPSRQPRQPKSTDAPYPAAPKIEDIISRSAETYGVDPALIHAVIRAESDFDESTTSSKGAMGLMQLMPETASDLGVKNAYDPVENVMGGTRYLKLLLDRYDGRLPVALAAYNWGMGNVERNPGRLPEETRTYISRVNRYYDEAKAG